MKPLRRFLDATFGRWIRHFFFVLLRSYYGLFFNISIADKSVLQDLPGGLILCSHGSRHDGPMIACMLYPTRRVRPAVLYSEYYSALQWFPLMIAGAVPMSSPKTWSKERRAIQKTLALRTMGAIIENGNMVLLYPAGRLKQQKLERIEPHFSGAYETLKTLGDIPVVTIRIRGLSPHEPHKFDLFYSFLGRRKGRRHVLIDIRREEGLDTSLPLAEFNARLEDIFNEGLHDAPSEDSIAEPSRQ